MRKKKIVASKQKIFQMLTSADEEVIRLGMILALNRGVMWCKENIPDFGPNDCSHVLNPSISTPDFGFRKKSIGIMHNHVLPGIDCRYLKDFDHRDVRDLIHLK